VHDQLKREILGFIYLTIEKEIHFLVNIETVIKCFISYDVTRTLMHLLQISALCLSYYEICVAVNSILVFQCMPKTNVTLIGS